MAGITIVFDFDKTMVDVDSDNWVVDELGATDLFNQLLPTMPWNSLMDEMMSELHAQGKTIEDIKDVLRRIPIHPKIVPTIKTAHALGCDLRIVSDANLFFIETIVDHLGIKDCFSEINTNPSYVDEEGRLRISPFVDFQTAPHGCSLCPPNMCKGMIIDRIQATLAKEGKQRIIYLGDGAGDFCPSLKLRDGDFMMPRKNFPVWGLICENRALLRAEIHEWIDGEDMEKIVMKLIEKIKIQDSVQLLSVDFKIETMPIALPQPVKVHQ
ncbi:inorganic pyrophosphatase 1-like [Salvia miltiorrhiza]|uniref:inorganic pyrophosphatase 1-like n=1 Tax=Salvia miltiorrhiza TaxID=226208 RepID=UPI0025AD8234|nr:inorganic pyrophosphatase 1-like [Salvia miltiorrhiza]